MAFCPIFFGEQDTEWFSSKAPLNANPGFEWRFYWFSQGFYAYI